MNLERIAYTEKGMDWGYNINVDKSYTEMFMIRI